MATFKQHLNESQSTMASGVTWNEYDGLVWKAAGQMYSLDLTKEQMRQLMKSGTAKGKVPFGIQ